MLINNPNKGKEHVKFISYSGKYPNLCSGQLVVEIDGKIVKFGHNTFNYEFSKDINKPASDGAFERFWASGGDCYLNNYSDEYIESGKWQIDTDEIPEQFRKYAAEFDEVLNSNVQYGCCGGCI